MLKCYSDVFFRNFLLKSSFSPFLVKVLTSWISFTKPSLKQIIQIKKQSVEQIIESMSKRNDSKCENEFRRHDMKNIIRDSEDESKTAIEENNFKDPAAVDVSSESNVQAACKINGNLQHPGTSEFEKEIDETKVKIANKSRKHIGTNPEELNLDSENFSDFSAKAIVSWLKPVLLKMPNTTTYASEKLSKWISYVDVKLDEPPTLDEEKYTKREMKLSQLSEFNIGVYDQNISCVNKSKSIYFSESDVAIDHASDNRMLHQSLSKRLTPYSTRNIPENNCCNESRLEPEHLLNCELSTLLEGPHSKSTKHAVVDKKNFEQTLQNEWDLTKFNKSNLRKESFPQLIDSAVEQSLRKMKMTPASGLELKRMYAIDKTDETRTSVMFEIRAEEEVESQNLEKIPSLTDITDELSREVKDQRFVTPSKCKLEKLFADTERKNRNFKG